MVMIFLNFMKISSYLRMRESMLREGIQSVDLANIRCKAGDKKSLVKENKLNQVYGNKYKIQLDHEILKDRGVFLSKSSI